MSSLPVVITLRAVNGRPSTSSSTTSASSEEDPDSAGTITPWTYASTRGRDTKALPLPPPVLQPLRKEETVGGRPRTRNEPAPIWLGWLAILPGIFVALLSAGLATTLALYLMMMRGAFSSRGFVVHERGRVWGLFASTVITNASWAVSFPILVSLSAYSIASSWLAYQRRPKSLRVDLLTPLQYAILFKLFSSPGPRSFVQASSYLADKRRRVQAPAPAFFAHGVVLIGTVLGLTYLLTIADMWLHASVSVTESLTHYPLPPTLTLLILLYAHSLLALTLTIRVASLRSPVIKFAERVPLRDVEAQLDAEPVVPFPPGATPTVTRTGTRTTTRNPSVQATPRPAPSLALPPAITLSPPRAVLLLPPPTTQSTSVRATRSVSISTTVSRSASTSSSSSSSTKCIPALPLVYAQLTNAFAPISARLASPARLRSSASRVEGLIGALHVEDANTARVEVGVWRPDKAKAKDGNGRRSRPGTFSGEGSDKEGVFGVYKKVVPWRGEIY